MHNNSDLTIKKPIFRKNKDLEMVKFLSQNKLGSINFKNRNREINKFMGQNKKYFNSEP